MGTSIRPEILYRFLLARDLLADADYRLAQRAAWLSHAKAILSLHDAAEAALGAIAEFCSARVGEKTYLPMYFEAIAAAAPASGAIPMKAQMLKLNAIRNALKHQGVLPDSAEAPGLRAAVGELMEHLAQTYLGIPLDRVSRRAFILNARVRERLEDAAKHVTAGRAEDAVLACAIAWHELAGHRTTEASSGWPPGSKVWLATRPFEAEFLVDLLALGIDFEDYRRFQHLTPGLLRHAKSGELRPEWDKVYTIAENWAAENLEHCQRFVEDAALAYQRRRPSDDGLIPFEALYCHEIEALGEPAAFWNLPPEPHALASPSDARRVRFTLPAGRCIRGHAYGTNAGEGLLYLFMPNAEPDAVGDRLAGFVDGALVRVRKVSLAAPPAPQTWHPGAT